MVNPERKRQNSSFFENFKADKVRIITNPSAYKPESLKILIAAQMIAGRREIVVRVNDTLTYLIEEKTLHKAIGFPTDKLKSFLEEMANSMRESKEVIFRETFAFSIN